MKSKTIIEVSFKLPSTYTRPRYYYRDVELTGNWKLIKVSPNQFEMAIEIAHTTWVEERKLFWGIQYSRRMVEKRVTEYLGEEYEFKVRTKYEPVEHFFSCDKDE